MGYSIDREGLEREYALRLPLFEALELECLHEIETALAREEIKFHSVTHRVKTLKSLCDKAEAKELEDPLTTLADVVGIRVVALFLGDIDRIISLLRKTFDVESIDNKVDDGDPAKFGYLSVHLIARIKKSFSGTRYDSIKHLRFEIQIRTIAMDAWASASHYLDYKSEDDIPSDLKRDFHALSGLFYAADKHFEMFFRSRQASIREVQKLSRSEDFLNEAINLDTLSTYLAKRYPTRGEPDAPQVSRLVTSLREAGLQTLSELDVYLNRKMAHLESREIGRNERFNRVGAVRISFSDDPSFEPSILRPDLPDFAQKTKGGVAERK